jgi:Dolichyl-phosphate-mannose-protein mannosyltransferase
MPATAQPDLDDARDILMSRFMADRHASGPTPARVHTSLVIALGLLAVGALVVRVASIAEPLGIDQSLWASAVRGMSKGQLLYRDVWEQRPPGIYWIYLAGFQLFGWSASTVAWLDILAATGTTLLLWAIARRLAGSIAGLTAAALYAVLTMPAWLFRYGGFLERSVCETFIAVCASLSAWCAVRFVDRRSVLDAGGIGLFAGAAVVLKPNAGLYLLAVLVWTVLYSRRTAEEPLAPLIRPIVIACAATAVAPILALLWLWRLDLLHEARIAVIDFNRFYVSQGFTVGGYAVDFSKAAWLRMKQDPLWLAGGIGALFAIWDVARTRRLPPLAGLAVIWGGTAALVIVVNGARLYNTYFLQAYPPLALLSTWVLIEASRVSRPRRYVSLATAALMAILLVQRSYATKVFGSALEDFDSLRGRSNRTAYLERFGGYGNNRGYSARANTELADYVREHTAPGDQVFLFGINGAGVYFAADRLTAHRFLRVNFFVETDFPDRRFRLDAVLDDLAARKPRYIIFERLNSGSDMGKAADSLPEQPAVLRLLSSYQKDVQIEDFTLYRLID